jgi:hypothetical protein
MRSAFMLLSVLLLLILPTGAQTPSAPSMPESKQAKISRALAAGPVNITKGAKIVDVDENGGQIVLRQGNGTFTCFPGHPGIVGDVAYCANPAALQWQKDFDEHKPKPSNTEPGIEYMFLGGSDWSGSDPMASSGTPIKEPPHWMMMWPFDPETTGLPTEPKQTGTWIMYAGTPWAHLMINQRP